MIQEFVDRFMANKQQLEAAFAKEFPSYESIVKETIRVISSGDYENPDPERIHVIDDGDYQGTLLFVIGGHGYQPRDYWYVRVSYGSCSGCDTLDALRDLGDYDVDAPNKKQIAGIMSLALHVVENLKAMQ